MRKNGAISAETPATAGNAAGLPAGFSAGPLRVSPPLVLAPMAGVTTPVLRELIAGFGGCGLYLSEMISSRRVTSETPRHSPHLRIGAGERPFLFQLFGGEAAEMARAAEHLMRLPDERGECADGLDLNMGCSAPAIRRKGAGSALLGDPDRARTITAACRKVVPGALSVKLRIGERDEPETMIRFVRTLVDEGVDVVTLHPRLTNEKFKRPAAWTRIRELREAVGIPVVGNGDIRAPEDVPRRFRETGCHGIMIGRLAAARPWIFRQITDDAFSPPGPSDVFEAFLEGLCRHYRPEQRLRHLALFGRYFARNFGFGHLFNAAVDGAPDLEAAARGARAFFSRNPEESAAPRPALSGYW